MVVSLDRETSEGGVPLLVRKPAYGKLTLLFFPNSSSLDGGLGVSLKATPIGLQRRTEDRVVAHFKSR